MQGNNDCNKSFRISGLCLYITDVFIMYRKLYIAGIFMYLLLFVLAILFYQERTAFVDISYHLFHIIKKSDFAIQNMRFGAIVTQIFPLLASKLSLPLKAVALIYSLGYITYYFLCYLACGHLFKQCRVALVLLMFNSLFIADSFYWMQSELQQAIAMMLVVYAFISGKKWAEVTPVSAAILFVGIYTLVFFHALLILPFAFLCMFSLVRKDTVEDKKMVVTIAGFYLIMLVIKQVAFKSPYDAGAMSGLRNFIDLFPNYFTIPSSMVLWKNCLIKYQWIPFSVILVGTVYTLQKKWAQLVLFLGAAIGYIILVSVCYPEGTIPTFYIENLYLPFGVIIGLPLVYDVFPAAERKKLALPLLSLILLTATVRIYATHTLYTERLHWMKSFLVANKGKKLMVSSKKVPMDKLLMVWGTPYEFWLISTMEGDETAGIIISEDINSIKWNLEHEPKLITTWESFSYDDLDKRYFKFTDKTTPYTLIQ